MNSRNKINNKCVHGNKLAVGNKGGGRRPEWLKQKCQDITEEKKLIEFLSEVASGEYTEFVMSDGKATQIKCSARLEDRLKAISMILDRGFGKPVQDVKPVDEQGNYAPFHIYMPAQSLGSEGSVQ